MDGIATLREFVARHAVVPCGHIADTTTLDATTSSVCFCTRCNQAFEVPLQHR